MNSLHNPSKSFFCLAGVLVFSSFVCSCKTTVPDLKEDFVRSLKGANVDGYHFAIEENQTQFVVSLTNDAVRDLIRLDGGPIDLVLKYTRIKDKEANTAKTFKTSVVKTDSTLALLVKDFVTGEVVSRKVFPAPEPLPTFDSLEDCINDFNCKRRAALQCEANRTCEDQYASLTCCLDDGQCFSVHLIIRPTRLKCRLTAVTPDAEGFVSKQ